MGFAVMVRLAGVVAVTVPLAGTAESHRPPELVAAAAVKDREPPPRLEMVS